MKATEAKITADQSARLLDRLCTNYGFCLSPLWRARLINYPPGGVERYARNVYAAEGLDMDASDSAIARSVRQEVAEAFSRSATATDGIALSGYGSAEFSVDVIARWGACVAGLSELDGELHGQMFALAKFCKAHRDQARDVLAFLESVLDRSDADSEVANAVAVSFLLSQEFKDLALEVHMGPRLAAMFEGAQVESASPKSSPRSSNR